jgi:hypothetical protein
MLDDLFAIKYDRQNYNCAHFARDVWQRETGQDITETLSGFLLPPGERSVRANLRHKFKRLQTPKSPCIVLMHRKNSVPHVGVYLRDKVIHLHEKGVEFMPLDIATRGFKKLGFYVC